VQFIKTGSTNVTFEGAKTFLIKPT